jgi:outer membrane protein assembly factor BamB
LILLAIGCLTAVGAGIAWTAMQTNSTGSGEHGADAVESSEGLLFPEPASGDTDDDVGWPNLFGPLHTSVSRERGILGDWPAAGPPVLWRREIGSGYSVPVVSGDRLILLHRIGDEEIVECLSAETGERLWSHRYPTRYVCRFRYSSGPYSSPIIHDGRVFAVSAEGTMRCLQLADGELIWQRELCKECQVEEGLFAVGATPLMDEGRLIFPLGADQRDAGIIALDARTGETLWTATDHRAGYATPIAATIQGRRRVFVVTFEGLVALDPSDGRVWWTIDHRPKSPDSVNATSPVVYDDLVLMVTGPGPGSVCVRVLADGGYEEVWRDRRVLDSQFNPLVCLRGYVFGFTSRRQGGATLRCIELATGKMRWERQSELDRGTLLSADGKLIALGEHGHLAALAADPDSTLPLCMTAEPLLAAPCYSAPALHRGRLYLRNEHELLCLELRAP